VTGTPLSLGFEQAWGGDRYRRRWVAPTASCGPTSLAGIGSMLAGSSGRGTTTTVAEVAANRANAWVTPRCDGASR